MSTSRSKKPNTGQSKVTLSKRSGVGASLGQSRYGGGRSVYGTTRSQGMAKRGAPPPQEPHWKPPVKVSDEAGQDVTPQPLLHHDPDQLRAKGLLNESSTVTATMTTDMMSSTSIYQAGTVTASQFGGGPFTRSVLSQSSENESELQESIEPGGGDMMPSMQQIQRQEDAVPEELTETELLKEVEVQLQETETIWLLDMSGTCVPADTDTAVRIKEKNDKYQQLVKNKVGSDLYMDRAMNTFNDALKLKVVQTDKIGYNDMGVNATQWDMYDSFEAVRLAEQKAEAAAAGEDAAEDEGLPGKVTEKQETESAEKPARSGSGTPVKRSVNLTQAGKSQVSSTTTDTESIFATKTSQVVVEEDKSDGPDPILSSDQFKQDLFVMERVINLNSYQPKQAQYRSLPVISEKPMSEEEAAALEVLKTAGPVFNYLWAYSSPLVSGRNVSCMAWNKENPDLLVLGYGQFEFSQQKPGIVCCWSLKNPEYPERVFRCNSGVTAVDFSRVNPNVLAVGLYDGSISIFNVRHPKDESLLDSFSSPGKHTGPVWQVRWIEKERGSGEQQAEQLVSISADGRVVQWSLRKGFECNELMRLKRAPARVLHVQPGGKPGGKERKSEALICRYAGGFCFDFHKKDSNIYLAGTEEGLIYRCSCSYNEQYLDAYTGHTGPIYKIQWNPFIPDVFLTCSGDWSVKLWVQDRTTPVLSFAPSSNYVHDICWSPKSSTVFSCVNEGRVEIWDLFVSTLDPVVKFDAFQGVKLTTVSFANNSDSLLVGTSDGQLFVAQYTGMEPPHNDQEGALRKIIKATIASQLQSVKDAKEQQQQQLEKQEGEEGEENAAAEQ